MRRTLDDLRRMGLSDTEIAILAHTYEGRSRPLIAEIMGLTPATVSTYYYSARKKLSMAGLRCPSPRRGRPLASGVYAGTHASGREVLMDPMVMDKKFTDDRRYNAE